VIAPPSRYDELARSLSAEIDAQVHDKDLGAFSIALVDGDEIVWARGFGERAPDEAATAGTVYRVGSVSKLFTDIAVMQLVEKGEVDLDAPVSTYLPDFRPTNQHDKPITLRQLMCQRSGLVREPPVGHYFDPTEPTLAESVASLNSTSLVYEPAKRTKYSNAGIAVVGLVLEKLRGKPFTDCIDESILRPLGMTRSGFELDDALTKHLSAATMWTYDGREFEAPIFALGTSSAGNLYSTVVDQARFLRTLLDETEAPLLSRETLETMWTVQLDRPEKTRGFGLGFYVSELDGHRRVGHNGAVYGFSTTLAALPDERLGVVAVSACDVSNSVVNRIAEHALRSMLALRAGDELPAWHSTSPLSTDPLSRSWVGRFENADERTDEKRERIEIFRERGRLYLERGWTRVEIRADADGWIVDGRNGFGTRIERLEFPNALAIGGTTFRRVDASPPAPSPERWNALIGEYGWDHNTLFILEKEGRLHALIEWIFLYPLTEESENVFSFPEEGGLYHGEKLIFARGASGEVESVTAARVLFERRNVGTAHGETFRIEPVRPVPEIRAAALAATPPVEDRDFLETEFVELRDLDDTILYDIRYASTNNFMGSTFYREPHAFMQEPAARAVVRAHQKLKKLGYGLLIHDAYRPWFVTKMFWDATPEAQKQFVADPLKGSRHNRGCAVDLTLYSLETGKPIPMVSGYDEFTARSFPQYVGGTSRERWHRRLLRRTMEEEGFEVYDWEWWHFDFRDWKRYRIHGLSFEDIQRGS
jgi:CubicO group peptidase (beta-lactamase class C family)/D-alanyl-D-alanine dipeptidase